MSSVPAERIIQYLSEAQSDDHEIQERALRALASLTKVNPQNRNLVAHTQEAIPGFLTLSKSPSSIIQILSLAILFNLSLNTDLKQPLADMKTISHLNSIIASPDTSPESGRLASSLLCSLAMLDKNKAKFGVAGTIQLLVNTISGPRCHAASSHHLLTSLAELVHFHGNSTLAVRSGAVPALMRVVTERTDGAEDLAGTALAVLCLLAKFDEGLNALRRSEGIVDSMVVVLKGRCMLSKEGAAEILIRLFDESEGCMRDALRMPEFTSVLADLSVRGSVKAREKASVLMKKMMELADLDGSCDHADASPLVLCPVGIYQFC
ncbi:uncharacterized protein LOC21389079 [Morus notabilis]|nr:uncharacterized protein LOC21389079 [Morus notabilis]